jgi:hypothetical protein
MGTALRDRRRAGSARVDALAGLAPVQQPINDHPQFTANGSLRSERPDMVRSLVLVTGFPWGAATRLKLLCEPWLELIRTNRATFMKLLTLTALTPRFLSSLDPTTIEKLMDDAISATNWEGIARQVELDLQVDIRAHRHPRGLDACARGKVSRARCPRR